LRDEIVRQIIEHAPQTTRRGRNLIPLIDRPHVADYFRGKTRWTETRAATISKTNNQRQMLSDARRPCWSPIFQRCSLHSASIRLRGPEQQADVVLILDTIYRAHAA